MHTNGNETDKEHHYYIVFLCWHEYTLQHCFRLCYLHLQISIIYKCTVNPCCCYLLCLVGTDVRSFSVLFVSTCLERLERHQSSTERKKKPWSDLIMSAALKLKNCMLFLLSFLNPDLCYCHPIITLFLWQWFITHPKGNTILRTYRRHN